MQHQYENDVDFALKIKMLLSLAFVPPVNVIDLFNDLTDQGDFPTELQLVIDYFEDTWIGRPIVMVIVVAPLDFLT